MARGDTLVSPWIWPSDSGAADYMGRVIKITVNFNNATRALQSAVVHRDDGCMYTKILLDNPNDAVRAKRITAPVDGAGDRTYSAAAMASVGLNVIEDILPLNITAEP